MSNSKQLDAVHTASVPNTGSELFADTFDHDSVGEAAPGWTTISGAWSACSPSQGVVEFCNTATYGIARPNVSGQNTWSDYYVDATIVRDGVSAPTGGEAILGRVQDASHFYELELRKDVSGGTAEFWYVWKYDGKQWTEIAGGPFTMHADPSYNLRMAFAGSAISAYVAYDGSTNFVALGGGTDSSYATGGIGLRSWDTTAARFDNVRVVSTNAVAGVSPTPSPAPVAVAATPTPTSTPATVALTLPPVPPGPVFWQLGDPYKLATEGAGSDTPIFGSDGTASFALNRLSLSAPSNEYRNQIELASNSSSAKYFPIGSTYAFQFKMENVLTPDSGSGAQLLIWQIHHNGNTGGVQPPVAFQLRTLGGVNYLALYEYYSPQSDGGDGAIVWKTPYRAGGSDTWRFDVKISSGTDGTTKVYRNGSLVYTYSGPTLGIGALEPHSEFGAYESQWYHNPTYSSVTHQEVKFDQIIVTTLN